MTSISACLENAALRLRPCSDTAELDAQVLLARTLDLPRSWLAAHAEEQLEPGKSAALEGLIQRLEGGEPLPYVLGEWEFYSLPFTVTHDVLIPRPETELLVEQAIAWLRLRLAGEHESSTMEVLDVGTGSGCIAVALAVNVPGIHVLATDISAAALRVASANAEKNGVAKRITFLEADLVPDDSTAGHFSMITANLPYIPTSTLKDLRVFGREPTLALDGGADGLSLVRRLILRSPGLLAPGGRMLLEIEASEGAAVLSLACDVFEQAEIHLHKDLAGHDRLLEIQVQPMTLDADEH